MFFFYLVSFSHSFFNSFSLFLTIGREEEAFKSRNFFFFFEVSELIKGKFGILEADSKKVTRVLSLRRACRLGCPRSPPRPPQKALSFVVLYFSNAEIKEARL